MINQNDIGKLFVTDTGLVAELRGVGVENGVVRACMRDPHTNNPCGITGLEFFWTDASKLTRHSGTVEV